MAAQKAETLIHVTCPKCSFLGAVLAFEWFGLKSYFCPKCEHGWDVAPTAPAQKPELKPAPAATRR
jgi:hypothetical protein